MPPRRHRLVDVLWLVEGVPGGREAAIGRRHRSGCDVGRSEGPSPRDAGAQRGRRRPHPRKPAAQKKHDRGWGRRVYESVLLRTRPRSYGWSSNRTCRLTGRWRSSRSVPRSSFYRWCDRYQRGGPEALADRPSRPNRTWNRIPEAVRGQIIIDVALELPELSPRELAVRFTDERRYFCLGSLGLPAAEGARSDHQPGARSSSRPRRSSRTRPRRPTSSGRRTSPI